MIYLPCLVEICGPTKRVGCYQQIIKTRILIASTIIESCTYCSLSLRARKLWNNRKFELYRITFFELPSHCLLR